MRRFICLNYDAPDKLYLLFCETIYLFIYIYFD